MTPNARGVLLALLAAGLFSLEVAAIKAAAAHFHVFQILFFRQLLVLVSVLPALARHGGGLFATHHPGLHALRLLGAFVALALGTWSFAVLPLTTAVTVGFAKVFFGALLARWFLGERVGPQRLAAVVAGFVGVLVVMRPGVNGLADPFVLVAVLGAVGAAVAQVSVRRLAQSDSTATLLVYQALVVGLLAAAPMPWLWRSPTAGELLMLLGIGALATAGQWLAVQSLRLGEASIVGPIDYVRLAYAALLGYVLFAEIPDGYTLVGAAIIVAAALSMLARRREAEPR